MQGWSWVEEGWVVDTQGIADDAVDVDGWSYATDFGWLHMPPAAGSGRFRKVGLSVRTEHLLTTCANLTAVHILCCFALDALTNL